MSQISEDRHPDINPDAPAWFVYGHKPISEAEIRREMERQAGPQR